MNKKVIMQNNFFHEFKLVKLLFVFGLKDVSEGIKKMFADLVITIMRFGITIWLYASLFQYKGGEIFGINLQIAAWSMFFYFFFMTINPRTIASEIQKDIQSGKVEVILSKPVNYIYYKLGEYLGNRFYPFIFNSIIGTFCMIFFLGIPQNILSLNFLFTFPIVFVLCFILSFQIFTILGFLSFWMQDISPVRWIVDKFVMMLGGAYLPIAFFPVIMQKLALYSPIGASQFISWTAYPNWSNIYLKMISLQLFWVFVFGFILYITQKNAFKKLSVNGG
jgi:ABC-2 type transport system permease protein